MPSVKSVPVLILVLATALLAGEVLAQNNPRRRQRNRPQYRGSEGLPSDLEQAYFSAVDDHEGPSLQASENIGSESIRSTNENWDSYAPSTPASYQVECHIEVIQRRRRGGRCTRLGGTHMPFICQSGAHFEFNPDCEEIMSARSHPSS